MSDNKLKPCPYCGSKGELRTYYDFYRISCIDEDCQGYAYGMNPSTDCRWYGDIESAIEAWNKRAEKTCTITSMRNLMLYGREVITEFGLSCGHTTEKREGESFNYCEKCGAKVKANAKL